MRHTKFLITLAFLLGGVPAGQAEDGAYKEFKSWQTFCGQTRSCTMRQFLSDSPLSSVELKRSGKPEAPVAITVSASDTALTEGEGEAKVSIKVDGERPWCWREATFPWMPWPVPSRSPAISSAAA